MIFDGSSSPEGEALLIFALCLGVFALFIFPVLTVILLIVGAVLKITWLMVVCGVGLAVWFYAWFI